MLLDVFLEDLRKTAACICCLVILGPFLFFIGIWQFASSPLDHTLENNINLMNSAINLWASNYAQSFEKLNPSVFSEQNTKQQNLFQSNSPDLIEPSGMANYIPVKYVIETPYQSLIPKQEWNVDGREVVKFRPNISAELFFFQLMWKYLFHSPIKTLKQHAKIIMDIMLLEVVITSMLFLPFV